MNARNYLLTGSTLVGLASALCGNAEAAAKEETINAVLPATPDGLIAVHGVLYGVSQDGVASQGSIYSLKPPSSTHPGWTVDLTYVFDNENSDGEPSSLAADKFGNLYVNDLNTSNIDCVENGQGCGYFVIIPRNSVSQTVSFPGSQTPTGKVAVGRQGNLYLSVGSVLEVSPPSSGSGPYTTKTISTPGTTGAYVGGLVIGQRGALYGVIEDASSGVEQDRVVRLSPSSSEQGGWISHVLKKFDPGIKVGQIALSSSDMVFGTTSPLGAACSTGSFVVFELTPPANGGLWNETIIHDFANDPLGRPLAGYERTGYVEQDILSFGHDDSVYGAIAPDVITDESNSTIYRLTPPAAGSTAWTKTALYTFETPPKPTGGTTRGFLAGSSMVINEHGTIYGTAIGGVAMSGYSPAYQSIAFKITQYPN